MAHKNSDLQRINELIEIMKENDLVEVEIKHRDDKISLKRYQPQSALGGVVPIVGPNIAAVPSSGAVQTPSEEAPTGEQKQENDLVVYVYNDLPYYWGHSHQKLQ